MDWTNLLSQFGLGLGESAEPAMRAVSGVAAPAASSAITAAPGAQMGMAALGDFSPGMMSIAPGMMAGGPMMQDMSGMSGQWGSVQQSGMDPRMMAAMMGGMGQKPQQQQPQPMPMIGGGGPANVQGLFSKLGPQVAPRQVGRTAGLLDQILGSLQ